METGNQSVSTLSVSLGKPLNTHLASALRKMPCLSVLMVSTHRPVTKFLGLNFLMLMRSKTSLSTQDLYLILALVPAALPQVTMQRSNMSPV